MLKIERILCPTDFSDFSAKAYEYAESLARHYGAKLFLEHVVQPLTAAYPYYAFPDAMNEIYWNLSGEAKSRLEEMVKSRTHNGFKPQIVVEQGPIIDSILSFADKQHVDLIVMGTHGSRGIDYLLIGSVTEKVLRRAHCPVLAVRKPAHDFVTPESGEDPVQLRKILFCTDFSEHSEHALEYALSLALEYNAELTLLHVLENLTGSTDLQGEMARVIRCLEEPIPHDARNWCTIKSTVRIGKPYQEIVQLALESQTDLVVMGVRGRNALDLALFGSTTHRVIQLGPSPVLAVRG